MAGQNGITPLDEDNVQHKLSHDTRSGDLIFVGPGTNASNTAPTIVGGVMNLPFSFRHVRDDVNDPAFCDTAVVVHHPMRSLWDVISRTENVSQVVSDTGFADPFGISLSEVLDPSLEPSRWGTFALIFKQGPMMHFTTGQALGQGVTGALLLSTAVWFNGNTSGYLQIGQEIVQYSARTGATITVSARGRFGTEDVAHKSGAGCRIFVRFASIDGYIAVVS